MLWHPDMLAAFVAEAYFLSVATSKLKTYAGDIIDHFDLRRYFQVLHGSELDGSNAAKGDLVDAYNKRMDAIGEGRTRSATSSRSSGSTPATQS